MVENVYSDHFAQGPKPVTHLSKLPSSIKKQAVPSLMVPGRMKVQPNVTSVSILQVLYAWVGTNRNQWSHMSNQSMSAAVRALKEAIVLDQESGGFRQAARHYQEAAELYENELNDPRGAYDAYGQAAELFSADESPAYVQYYILHSNQSNSTCVCISIEWPTSAISRWLRLRQIWKYTRKPLKSLNAWQLQQWMILY